MMTPALCPEGAICREGRDDAEKAFERFLARYQAKYDKAADCLAKDRETLLAVHDVPAEHWRHIRTGNPIESAFATVRHRAVRSKGCLSHETAKIMMFKTIQAAQRSWRKLDGQNQLPNVIGGIEFNDGVETAHHHAAASSKAVTNITAQLCFMAYEKKP